LFAEAFVRKQAPWFMSAALRTDEEPPPPREDKAASLPSWPLRPRPMHAARPEAVIVRHECRAPTDVLVAPSIVVGGKSSPLAFALAPQHCTTDPLLAPP